MPPGARCCNLAEVLPDGKILWWVSSCHQLYLFYRCGFIRNVFCAPNILGPIAIIIIAGAALGSEAGFLTGAMTAFVSNFIFGQGPWTPWQVFAFGMAGFLAGILFERGILKKTRLPLCIFGAVVVMLVVGPILDTCTLFTMSSAMGGASAAAIYLSGLPVNATLAVATVLTLLLVSQPMFEKLDRVKMKYGMMEG